MHSRIETSVVVIGAGPGGYTTAFRCADLGMKVTLVERYPKLGGVCLNVGCIPSKSLLHVAKIIRGVESGRVKGISFGGSHLDLAMIRDWKDGIVDRLAANLSSLAGRKGVGVICGAAVLIDPHTLVVSGEEEIQIKFEHAVVATGSRPAQLPHLPRPGSGRVWDSTDALRIDFVPRSLLVVGGGIIGMEMATFYSSLGSRVDVAEISDQLIPQADRDVADLFRRTAGCYSELMLQTRVEAMSTASDGVHVRLTDGLSSPRDRCYDAVLISVGRVPNSDLVQEVRPEIGRDDRGFILVDEQLRTSLPNIHAIGDVTGGLMLAHKSIYQGRLVAEILAGGRPRITPDVIPCIAYTDPEVAWVGLTEKEAQSRRIDYETATVPMSELGRALISGDSGLTKLILDRRSRRVIGGASVNPNAGELLGEIGLAIEMGCEVEDLALTMHAHPTFCESIGMAAELCVDRAAAELLRP